jgi:hypothetical protein
MSGTSSRPHRFQLAPDAGLVTEAEHNDRLAGALADQLVPGAQWRARYVEARDLRGDETVGAASRTATGRPAAWALVLCGRAGRVTGGDAWIAA